MKRALCVNRGPRHVNREHRQGQLPQNLLIFHLFTGFNLCLKVSHPPFTKRIFTDFLPSQQNPLEKLGEGRRAFCCGLLGCWRKPSAEYPRTAMAGRDIEGGGSKPLYRAKSVSLKGRIAAPDFTHQQQVRVSAAGLPRGRQRRWEGGMRDPGKGGARRAGAQLWRLAQLAAPGGATRIITSAAGRAGSWAPYASSPRAVSTLPLPLWGGQGRDEPLLSRFSPFG